MPSTHQEPSREHLEELSRILDRNIQWIASADTKATTLFAVASAMLATLAAILPNSENFTTSGIISSLFAVVPLLYSIFEILRANFPRLDGPRGSLIYFGGIATHDEEQYRKKLMSCSLSELMDDYARQCYRNAEIACKKYSSIKNSTIALFISIIPWLIAIWILFNHQVHASST